jgi:hypothetical protein
MYDFDTTMQLAAIRQDELLRTASRRRTPRGTGIRDGRRNRRKTRTGGA